MYYNFFSVNLKSYGHRLKPVSIEFLKLWALCEIYSPQAKKEYTPTAIPILLKQTLIRIMCNLSASMFCLPVIYSNSVQHFALSNEAEAPQEKLCLSKHFWLGCYFFNFISESMAHHSFHWHNISKGIQLPSTELNSQRSLSNFRISYKNCIRKNIEM